MRTKPSIPDDVLKAHLESHFGIKGAKIEFLPLGADRHSAVYRVEAEERLYFLKLRSGEFNELSVRLPAYLKQYGVEMMLAALVDRNGRLWVELEGYHLVLFPFVEGRNAFEVELNEEQWSRLGTAMRAYHRVELPSEIKTRLPVERFSPRWRIRLRTLMIGEARQDHSDPIATELAAGMQAHRSRIESLIAWTERLGKRMDIEAPQYVLCHTDIHGGNLLVTPDGELYIIDWDSPLLAPKERDLMFIGGGIGEVWDQSAEVEAFYRGYFWGDDQGPGDKIDLLGLAYYRSERIIEDLALFADAIFHPTGSSSQEDLRLNLHYFISNFRSGGVLDIAEATYDLWEAHGK